MQDRPALRNDTTGRRGGTIQDETQDETEGQDGERDGAARRRTKRGARRYAPFLPAHFVVPWQRISIRGGR